MKLSIDEIIIDDRIRNGTGSNIKELKDDIEKNGQIQPPETAEEIAELREENTKLWKKNQELKTDRNEWKQRFNEVSISSQEDAAADTDANILAKAIRVFLSTYGGKAWSADRKNSIAHTEELIQQVKNLNAFTRNLYEMLTEGDEL